MVTRERFGMFWKWVTSAGAALLAFMGVALLNCTFLLFDFIDATGVCVEADVAIPGGSVIVGVILTVGGVALIGYAWTPFFAHRREQAGIEMTEEALVGNVHRLPDEVSGPVQNLLNRQDTDQQAESGAGEVSGA